MQLKRRNVAIDQRRLLVAQNYLGVVLNAHLLVLQDAHLLVPLNVYLLVLQNAHLVPQNAPLVHQNLVVVKVLYILITVVALNVKRKVQMVPNKLPELLIYFLFLPEDCETQEKDSCESSMEEKNLCNFLADNPELKNCKPKKEPPSDDIDIACDSEVWLLQCPKNFDPNDILNCVMCPPKKGCGPNVDCCADRFKCKKALVVIAPEKAADLELLCDNMKLVSEQTSLQDLHN